MNHETTSSPTLGKPLRLWPGVALALLLVTCLYLVPAVAPGAIFFGVMAGFAGGAGDSRLVAFFSRAPWLERLGAVAMAAAAMYVAYRFLDVSVARGNMGFQYIGLAVPVVSLALVAGAAAGRRLTRGKRWAVMAAFLVVAAAGWTLLRSNGVTGGGMPQLAWRWEDGRGEAAGRRRRALLKGAATPAAPGSPASWPGLRGPGRDGVVPGVRLATDWTASPPVELWRRKIGPGVSSFAISGNLLYTQEQRGEEEIVTCHNLETGEPVWRHHDAARFWDAHVGAGPRATPTLAGGRVYTLGATGILNALDAATGAVVWTRDAAADADAKLPMWGFVSSPLVAGNLLIVQAGSLVAYDLATGEKPWVGPPKRSSYSSPQLVELAGIPQILLVGHAATISVAPADGSLLWEHPWPGIGIVQPALVGTSDLLVSLVDNGASPIGTRRIALTQGGGEWKVEERWTSSGLKTSFSDVVVHQGHAYGIDGRILACIDLEKGERAWKGGRYGEGQLLLLPDQDLLLVLTEQGELALVEAKPEKFTELARIPLIEGKTWSQPALVGDVLLVRNGEEMAAFRLPTSAKTRS